MTAFTARPLGVLDRIYRFVGGLRGNSDVDLVSPIQLVHDVSRQAELGSGRYALVRTVQNHVAAGTIAETVDPYSNDAALYVWQGGYAVPSAEEVVWVGPTWGALSAGLAANVAGAAARITYPAAFPNVGDGPSSAPPPRQLAVFGTGTSYGNTLQPSALPYQGALGRWVPLPRGGTIVQASSEVGGVGITVEMATLIWIGPLGSSPPIAG